MKFRTPPVNIIGGYRFPGAPKIDLSQPPAPAIAPATPAIGDDGIPSFLKRTVPAVSAIPERATEEARRCG
jgi:hypothetical protein